MCLSYLTPLLAFSQDQKAPALSPRPGTFSNQKQSDKSGALQPALSEQQELQKAIGDAGNDRAALVRNLDAYLKKYPQSSQRTQIYRAIVEASLQLRDFPRATDAAERMVALNPEDPSVNVLAIQLLERYGDAAGWQRATYYCGRVLQIVAYAPRNEKSPRLSNTEWEQQKKQDEASIILARGRLYQKLNNYPDATKDYEASYALLPAAAPAEQLGELAELQKDLPAAIQEYARAFALTDATSGPYSRAELRKKIGNVWRLAHGSEDGLGEYLLRTFDEMGAAAKPAAPARNQGLKEPYEFTLRKAPEGTPFPLAATKGKIVVLNFWATWCGPCRALEPHFERLALGYAEDKGVVFYGINCDEDEALVGPYLEEEKAKTTVLFADGLDRLLSVDAYPTTVILDRMGKIAFRASGFQAETVDKLLGDAIERLLHLGDTPAATAAAKP